MYCGEYAKRPQRQRVIIGWQWWIPRTAPLIRRFLCHGSAVAPCSKIAAPQLNKLTPPRNTQIRRCCETHDGNPKLHRLNYPPTLSSNTHLATGLVLIHSELQYFNLLFQNAIISAFVFVACVLGCTPCIGRQSLLQSDSEYRHSKPRRVRRPVRVILSISNIWPDGVPREVYLINDQQPGPLIEAEEGDNLAIFVQNDLPVETTIHWHGE